VTPEEGGNAPLVGWLLVGFGILDLFLAAFFLVRPPAAAKGRKLFPVALALGALVLLGLGAAFLGGVIAPR
jgi:hypothetical protein